MISFEEFKKSTLKAGVVKFIDGKKAQLDFGDCVLECKVGGLQLSAGDLVFAVLENNNAAILAAQDAKGNYNPLTVEKPVKPGSIGE